MTDDKVNRDWNYDIHQAVYPLFKFRGALAGREAVELSPEDCADIICDAIQEIVADIEFRLSWWQANYGQGVYAPSKEFNDRVMDALDALPPQTILLPDDGQPSEPSDPGLHEKTLHRIFEKPARESSPLPPRGHISPSRTRTDPDAAFSAFMSMPEDEWLGLLLSLAGGGVLEPAEQQGFDRAVKARG